METTPEVHPNAISVVPPSHIARQLRDGHVTTQGIAYDYVNLETKQRLYLLFPTSDQNQEQVAGAIAELSTPATHSIYVCRQDYPAPAFTPRKPEPPRTLNPDETYLHLLQSDAEIQQAIDMHQKNGEIGLLEEGRDCDGVEYAHGSPTVVAATIEAIKKCGDDKAEWADGPFALLICAPDFRRESYSYDRTMAAHENGSNYNI